MLQGIMLYSLDKEELYKIVHILKKCNLDGGRIALDAVGSLIFNVYNKNILEKLVSRLSSPCP